MSNQNEINDGNSNKKEIKYQRFTKDEAEGKEKNRLQEEIKKDIEKFIENGGEIEKLPIIRKTI